MTRMNKRLGCFQLTDLPAVPRGVLKVMVTFDIDANGILNVSARETHGGTESKIQIKNDARMSKEEIDEQIRIAVEMAAEDAKVAGSVQAVEGLKKLAYNMRNVATNKNFEKALSAEDKAELQKKTVALVKWIKENYTKEKEVLEAKTKETNEFLNPYRQKIMRAMKAKRRRLPAQRRQQQRERRRRRAKQRQKGE